MTTTPRPMVPVVGFLERNRGIGTALTVLMLVGIGVALGGAVGLLLTRTLRWLLASAAGLE